MAQSHSATANGQEQHQWRAALKDLAGGPLGHSLAGNSPLGDGVLAATPSISLAFASLLSGLGTPLGAIQHSSTGGDQYRRRFLGLEAPKALAAGVDLQCLTGRPIFGLYHADFPSWGALSAEEVQSVVKDRTADDLPYLDDSQMAAWLFELWDFLTAAAGSREELVTVYL